MNANFTYTFLGAAAPTTEIPSGATDAIVDNHILKVLGMPQVDVRLIESFLPQDTVAEALGAATITPTASGVAGTQYTILLEQFVPTLGTTVRQPLTVVGVAADTATTICNQWRSQVAAITGIKAAATGTTTLILTPTTGSPKLIVTNISPVATIGVSTATQTVAVNTFASLNLQNLTGQVSGQTYFSYEMIYRDPGTGDNAGNVSIGRKKHKVFINKGATNYAAFAAAIVEIKAGFTPGASTANPETGGL